MTMRENFTHSHYEHAELQDEYLIPRHKPDRGAHADVRSLLDLTVSGNGHNHAEPQRLCYSATGKVIALDWSSDGKPLAALQCTGCSLKLWCDVTGGVATVIRGL